MPRFRNKNVKFTLWQIHLQMNYRHISPEIPRKSLILMDEFPWPSEHLPEGTVAGRHWVAAKPPSFPCHRFAKALPWPTHILQRLQFLVWLLGWVHYLPIFLDADCAGKNNVTTPLWVFSGDLCFKSLCVPFMMELWSTDQCSKGAAKASMDHCWMLSACHQFGANG